MADILVPFDFSKNATLALDQAILIASSGNKRILLIHITNDIVAQQYPKSWKFRGDLSIIKSKIASLVEKRMGIQGLENRVKVSILVKEAATISGGIISEMLRTSSKLLVMGTHGSTGVYEKIFGSNTSVLVNHSLFPLLVIPHNWKPLIIENLVAVIKLNKLSTVSKTLKLWARFFRSDLEAIQFTIAKEAEGAYANKTRIDNIPCKLIINPIETSLAVDIEKYSQSLKSSAMVLFTREKTFLEKLLVPNLSYKLSGRLNIPLLTLPLEGVSKKD